MSQPVIHMTDLGPWVDSFRPVPKTERKMSIDILISKAKDLAAKGEAGGTGGSAPGPIPGATPEATPGGAPGEKPTAKGAQAAEETVDLVVEILTVEMRDPGPQAEEEQWAPQVVPQPEAHLLVACRSRVGRCCRRSTASLRGITVLTRRTASRSGRRNGRQSRLPGVDSV